MKKEEEPEENTENEEKIDGTLKEKEKNIDEGEQDAGNSQSKNIPKKKQNPKKAENRKLQKIQKQKKRARIVVRNLSFKVKLFFNIQLTF